MKSYELEFVANHCEQSTRLHELVVEEWNKAVGRFGRWIKAASIRLTDVNGPRGGVCKRCQIVLHTSAGTPIVIQETQDRFPAAISRAVERVGHTLSRKVVRQREHRRPKHSRSALHQTAEIPTD